MRSMFLGDVEGREKGKNVSVGAELFAPEGSAREIVELSAYGAVEMCRRKCLWGLLF